MEAALQASAEYTPVWKGWLLIRVVDGEGYWMRKGEVTAFGTGSMMIVNRATGDIIRASSLGSLKMHMYSILPESIGGILSYHEIQQLSEQELNGGKDFYFFTAESKVALKAPLMMGDCDSTNLQIRFSRAQLWAEALETGTSGQALFQKAESVEDQFPQLREKMHLLVGNMSASELSLQSVAELAARIGCSTRHFHRLFKEAYSKSFREFQTGHRLAKASKYLAESNSKIINIAQETGYNHLGLFNRMFKKQYGMTPGDWREKVRKNPSPSRTRKSASMGSLLMIFLFAGMMIMSSANAQTNKPVEKGTNVVANPKAFEVRHYQIDGNTVLDPKVIDKLLEPATGKEVTFEQINKGLLAVQKAYSERGLLTVKVTLPQQKLTNATIRVKIIEAPLAAITISGNKHFTTNYVLRKLPSLHTNVLLNSVILQRELDAANSGRDMQIYTLIGPGPEPDTSALNLRIKDRVPVHGRLEVDNYNIPNSLALRMNANVQYDNLWNMDHQLGFQYGFTPETLQKYHDKDEAILLDAPLIANYSVYYKMPLGHQTAVEREVEANPGQFGYNETQHRFVAPPVVSVPQLTMFASHSTADTGRQSGGDKVIQQSFVNGLPSTVYSTNSVGENTTLNNDLGMQFTMPLPTIEGIKVSFNAGFDFKQFRMASFNTNFLNYINFFQSAFGQNRVTASTTTATNNSEEKLEYLPVNAGFSFVIPDRFGMSFVSMSASYNPFPVFSRGEAFRRVNISKANYLLSRFNFSREQNLYHNWGTGLRAAAQYSPDPLISNEEFGIGGMSSIRGYHEGDAFGDSGWSVGIEPHTPDYKVASVGSEGNVIPWTVRFSTFMDFGQEYLNNASPGIKSYYNLAGAGAAVSMNVGDHFSAKVNVGVPMENTQQTKAGSTRVGFSISAQF